MKKQIPKVPRERDLRLTRPPRLEGAVKEAMMQPKKKKKGTHKRKEEKQ